MGDFDIPSDAYDWPHLPTETERAVFYQKRMLAIRNQLADPAVLTEAQMITHYKQMCQWDSARVERDKALQLLGQPEPVPAHVQTLANIFFP